MHKRTRRLACVLLFLGSGGAHPQAQATACDKCTGKSAETIYRGGNSSPLTFHSLRNEQAPVDQQRVLCYERSVQNHSNANVPDVDWPVAGYYRKVLPPGKPVCEVTSMPGPSDSPAGRLYYGPGRNDYPSTSYAPKAGWPALQAKASRLLLPVSQERTPPLQAMIQVPFTRSDGQSEIVSITLRSSVMRRDSGTFEYTYELLSDGERPIFVFWDIPQSQDLVRQFRNPDLPITLSPRASVKGLVTSREEPAWTLSPVVVTDESRDTVWSFSYVAVYGSKAGTFSANKIYMRFTPQR